MHAGQTGNVLACLKPRQQGKEGYLPFATDSQIGPEVRQSGIGENAVARAAQNNWGIRQGAADVNNLLDGSQQEAGVEHGLVVNVANRHPDNVGREGGDSATDHGKRVCFGQ